MGDVIRITKFLQQQRMHIAMDLIAFLQPTEPIRLIKDRFPYIHIILQAVMVQ